MKHLNNIYEILCDVDYMDPDVHCLRKAVKLKNQ